MIPLHRIEALRRTVLRKGTELTSPVDGEFGPVADEILTEAEYDDLVEILDNLVDLDGDRPVLVSRPSPSPTPPIERALPPVGRRPRQHDPELIGELERRRPDIADEMEADAARETLDRLNDEREGI